MEDTKRNRILDAATKVIAEKGYEYAAISEIAKEAGMSTGLIYSYFENKMDLLFSIVLMFLQNMNRLNRDGLRAHRTPFEKLHFVVGNFEALLSRDEKALFRVKVITDARPHIVMSSDPKLEEKKKEIIRENREFAATIEEIVQEGQKRGLFERALEPSAVRQIISGSVERVIFGLLYRMGDGEEVRYNAEDGHRAISRMIDKFLKA